ncbi:uncharacterized protein LOC133189304 [Saccostrea echinata]|uniref:uncharacterized protein LOC133189304 n=1 Tax=Saccostrea echinata TaxID=191078 RepID=UPI002A83AF6C|nr:uncharacterized protein LOC133189304 [Saccostrea echinata]
MGRNITETSVWGLEVLKASKDDEIQENAKVYKEDVVQENSKEHETDIDVQLACLNNFLYQIGGKLNKNKESIKKLKYILQAARAREIKMNKDSNVYENNKVTEEDEEYKEIGGIKKGRDLLEFMNRKYDFNLNFFKLKGFLEAVGENGLSEECNNFNKENNQVPLCKGHVSKEGRQDLRLKLAEGKQHLNKDDIFDVQRDLCKSVNAAKDEDILMNGVASGSIVIHFLVMNYLVDILKVGNFEALYKYGLIEVTLMGHCIYRCNNSGMY